MGVWKFAWCTRRITANLFDEANVAEFVNKLSRSRWFINGDGLGIWDVDRRLGSDRGSSSGVAFDRFVQERITGPLGMRDTAFY